MVDMWFMSMPYRLGSLVQIPMYGVKFFCLFFSSFYLTQDEVKYLLLIDHRCEWECEWLIGPSPTNCWDRFQCLEPPLNRTKCF